MLYLHAHDPPILHRDIRAPTCELFTSLSTAWRLALLSLGSAQLYVVDCTTNIEIDLNHMPIADCPFLAAAYLDALESSCSWTPALHLNADPLP
jgi:hypothetical protein